MEVANSGGTPAELRREITDEPVICREGKVKETMCYNKRKSLWQKEGAGAVRFGGDLELQSSNNGGGGEIGIEPVELGFRGNF
jgi:hypothetical protein